MTATSCGVAFCKDAVFSLNEACRWDPSWCVRPHSPLEALLSLMTERSNDEHFPLSRVGRTLLCGTLLRAGEDIVVDVPFPLDNSLTAHTLKLHVVQCQPAGAEGCVVSADTVLSLVAPKRADGMLKSAVEDVVADAVGSNSSLLVRDALVRHIAAVLPCQPNSSSCASAVILITGGAERALLLRRLHEKLRGAGVIVRYVAASDLFLSCRSPADAAWSLQRLFAPQDASPDERLILILDGMELFSVTDTNVFVPAATHTLCEELERAMVVRRGILVVAGAASTCAVHPSLFGVTRVHVVLPLTEGPEGKKVSSCADVPAAKSSVLTPLGIDEQLSALRSTLLDPLHHSRVLLRLGVAMPKGAIVVGPTGCGKTMLLSWVAQEVREMNRAADSSSRRDDLSVISVDTHSLVTKEVGESEKRVSALFAQARGKSPCILLLDNIDAIAVPRCEASRTESDVTSDRILSTLLLELDGVKANRYPVVVIATAPTVHSVDAALVRSGRLGMHIELGPPDLETIYQLVDMLLISPLTIGSGEHNEKLGTPSAEHIAPLKAFCCSLQGQSCSVVQHKCREVVLNLFCAKTSCDTGGCASPCWDDISLALQRAVVSK